MFQTFGKLIVMSIVLVFVDFAVAMVRNYREYRQYRQRIWGNEVPT